MVFLGRVWFFQADFISCVSLAFLLPLFPRSKRYLGDDGRKVNAQMSDQTRTDLKNTSQKHNMRLEVKVRKLSVQFFFCSTFCCFFPFLFWSRIELLNSNCLAQIKQAFHEKHLPVKVRQRQLHVIINTFILEGTAIPVCPIMTLTASYTFMHQLKALRCSPTPPHDYPRPQRHNFWRLCSSSIEASLLW